MNRLLQSNIKKSIKIIAEENPKIPDHFIKVIGIELDKSGLPNPALEIAKIATQPIPWFYRDLSHEFQSPQQPFFGIYAVKNILRGILLGLRFIQGGDLLRENNFLAASIFSYYTAAFHLLHSYLAINGRIIIDIVKGPVNVINYGKTSTSSNPSLYATVSYEPLEPTPETIIAILTRQNSWKFEPRARSHSRKWKELEPIFIELGYDIPEFFYSFFEYILSYGKDSSFKGDNSIQDGLKRLSEIRHEAIYQGYGFDDFFYNGVVNRDLDWSSGFEIKSERYREFATGFLTHSINEFLELKKGTQKDYWNKIRGLINNSIFTPPFEVGMPRLAGNPELTESLESIYNLIMLKEI